MASILVIDDEVVLARQIAASLTDSGHDVQVAATAAEGEKCLRTSGADLVLLDLRLPDRPGLEVLDWIQDLDSTIAVILMTAYSSVPDVVRAMQSGAADYLQKPLDLDELGLLVLRIMKRNREARELAYHRERDRTDAPGVVGSHPSLHGIFEQLERLRAAALPPGRRPPILFTGETGTGKGLLARAAHDLLGGGPFIEINCTAMPESLIEAELFGHERGTF
ncbi:MAG: sigma-54-dependent Fis family transcriptional regulator, partial [Deltaproteobacteria bacterium]|nr:sigma-54-dependent Fis family transcriptional regulator [Deltaproteobacteria bacterium]